MEALKLAIILLIWFCHQAHVSSLTVNCAMQKFAQQNFYLLIKDSKLPAESFP